MEKLELKIENVGNEITIWQGDAPTPLPIKEPKIINLSGDIHSVSNYLKNRNSAQQGHSSQAVDPSKVIVEADKNGRTIRLLLDPENHYGATVTAKLEASDELKPFYINQEKKFSREQLVHLIKFSRLYFDDKQQHSSLLASISKLRIKTENELKLENDSKGNRTASSERKVIEDSGFAQFFNLFIPIFKGFPPIRIQVEICFEPSESGILFWLESPELNELTMGQVDSIFTEELESCEGFVVIHK